MTGSMLHFGFFPGACRGLLQTGLGLAFQSTLVLLAGLLAGRCLHRRGPAAAALAYRATAVAAVLGALLAVAIGGRFQPRWALALPAAQALVARAPATATVVGSPAIPMARFVPVGGPGLGLAPVRREAPRPTRVQQETDTPLRSDAAPLPVDTFDQDRSALPLRTTPIGWLYVLLAGIWIAGAAGLLAGLGQCYRSMERLRAASGPAGAEAEEMLHELCAARGVRPPLLRVSARVRSPVLIGLWRPAILLPASYVEDFDAPALRAVLAHELAHRERGDCAWLLLVRLACAVGWVQPLGWVLAGRLEASSEEVCDQEVLRRDARPDDYARCLVDLAERLVPSRTERAVGAGIAPCRSALEQRVRNILHGPRGLTPLTGRLRAAVLLGAVALTGAGLLLVAAAAPSGATASDPLAGDARLAEKVKVSVEGLPVSDLLAQLVAKTGVSLAVEPDIGDDKVIIFGPARPLRETMSDLAALFNDRWEGKRARNGAWGYRLIRTPSARELEASFARRTTEAQMGLLEHSVRALDMKPDELAGEGQYIQGIVSDRKQRLALRLYEQLSQAQREMVFRTESLRVPFRALTPAQQAPIRTVFAETIAQEQAFSDERAKQMPPEFADQPPLVSKPEDLENGEIRFGLFHSGGMIEARLQFGKRRSPGFAFADFGTGTQWALPLQGNPYTGEPVAADASLPGAKATRAAAAEKAWPDRVRRLAEGSGVAVLADYYRGRPMRFFYIPPLPGTPDAKTTPLDTLCGQSGYLWWMKGKTLLLRKRDWFDQQRYEIPDRWLLAMAQRARQAPLTCADVLRVLDLSDDQLLGLMLLSDRELGEDGQYEIFNRAEQIGGLREYLALVNTAPRKADGRIENTQLFSRDGTASGGFALKYATMTPLQRRLARLFLATQDYPISPGGLEQFSLTLFGAGNRPMTTPLGYQHVPFRLAWDDGGKEKISLGWGVDLPAGLPDDRRDRTRIEVMP